MTTALDLAEACQKAKDASDERRRVCIEQLTRSGAITTDPRTGRQRTADHRLGEGAYRRILRLLRAGG